LQVFQGDGKFTAQSIAELQTNRFETVRLLDNLLNFCHGFPFIKQQKLDKFSDM